jgi:MFS family permease
MSRLSPSEIALEGFRMVREHPKSVLVWGGVLALILLTGQGGAVKKMQEMGADPFHVNQADAASVLQSILPVYLMMVVAGLISGAVLLCAVYRAVFTPDDDKRAFLRLGRDEFRQVVVNLVYFAVFIALIFAVTLIASFFASLISRLVPSLTAAVTLLVVLASIAVFVVVLVRLSLMPAVAFAEHRVDPNRAWRLTDGHFWDLAGAYFLAIVFSILVYFLGLVITFVVVAVAAGGNIEAVRAAGQPDWHNLASVLAPLALLSAAMSALMFALLGPLLFAPSAVAYRELVSMERS